MIDWSKPLRMKCGRRVLWWTKYGGFSQPCFVVVEGQRAGMSPELLQYSQGGTYWPSGEKSDYDLENSPGVDVLERKVWLLMELLEEVKDQVNDAASDFSRRFEHAKTL